MQSRTLLARCPAALVPSHTAQLVYSPLREWHSQPTHTVQALPEDPAPGIGLKVNVEEPLPCTTDSSAAAGPTTPLQQPLLPYSPCLPEAAACQSAMRNPPRPPRRPDSSSSGSPVPDIPVKLLNKYITDARTSAGVLQLVCDHHGSFDAIHTATALHRTALWMQPAERQHILQHPGYILLLSLAEAKVSVFKKQATGNVLWALARLQDASRPQLLHGLASAAERNLLDMTAQRLSNSIWGLATEPWLPAADCYCRAGSSDVPWLANGKPCGLCSLLTFLSHELQHGQVAVVYRLSFPRI